MSKIDKLFQDLSIVEKIQENTGYLIKDVDSFMDSVHTSISRIEDTVNYRNRVEDLESLRALLKGG